jgi:hypothetical protein
LVYFKIIINTLSVNMASKINWLVNHTMPGSIVLQQWLTENRISHSLTQKYIQSGWLKKLFSGVYYRPTPSTDNLPDWVEALRALVNQSKTDAHLAGLTSLEQQGLSHYLSLNSKNIWVGVNPQQNLPKWFKEFANQNWLYSSSSKLQIVFDKDYTNIKIDGKSLLASTPELATYEVVDAIGKHITFEHAADLFQGLVNLSPKKVQSILSRSTAVRTNRIFLFLSHLHAHQWTKHLDESKITIGSGKRQVVKDGKYDHRYMITVPSALLPNQSNTSN